MMRSDGSHLHWLQHSNSSVALLGLLLTAVILIGGCASSPQPVHVTRDPQANFAALTTFAWDNGPETQASAPPISILDSNIRTAITSELQRKGYAEAIAGTIPQVLLQYETAAAEKIKSNPFSIGIGVGTFGRNGGGGVGVGTSSARNVREGTLVLRIIDPARNAEIWNGRVSRELAKDGPPDQALIQSAVGELLREFPTRTSDR